MRDADRAALIDHRTKKLSLIKKLIKKYDLVRDADRAALIDHRAQLVRIGDLRRTSEQPELRREILSALDLDEVTAHLRHVGGASDRAGTAPEARLGTARLAGGYGRQLG